MNDLKKNKLQRRAKRLYALCVCVALLMAAMVTPAFAASGGDPVGLILLGYGVLQVGLSLQSHDPSQRSNGMLTIAGGIVITFTKEILALITGSGA